MGLTAKYSSVCVPVGNEIEIVYQLCYDDRLEQYMYTAGLTREWDLLGPTRQNRMTGRRRS